MTKIEDYEHMWAGLDTQVAEFQSSQAFKDLTPGPVNTVGLVSHDGPECEVSDISRS
jgi:hypothetical protein